MSKTKIFLNLLFTGSCLVVLWRGVLFAQEDNLEVKGKIETDSLTVRGGASPPASAVKGEVFYRNDENKYYVFDGSTWQEIGAGSDRTVASQIVGIVGTTSSRYGSDQPCDGASDQEEIQQAIDNLGDNKGSVYLLEGTYNISDTTKVPSDVSIIGQGAGAVMFVINSSPLTTGVISNADDIGGNSRILIKNLRIDGNKDNNTNNNQCGIYFRNVNESLIANFWIENTKAQSIRFYGQVGHACDNNIISENMISKNTVGSLGYANILLQNFLRGIVSKNIFTADSPNTYGISLVSAKNITVTGNYIAPAHGSGIGQQSSSDNIIVGNKVVVSDAYNVAFNSRCVVAGNNLENEATTGTAIIDNQGPLNSVISDSIIQSSFEGIRLISKRHNISGNIDVISGNSHGIYLSAAGANTSKCNLISSNYIYKSSGVGTTYGVYIWLTSASNNYLVGNLIGGAFTAYIQDNGTSTFYTDKLKITLQKGEYTGLENGGTLTPSGPASYLRLNPASNITLGNPAIADGKTGGDILILENTSDTYTIMINDNNNVQLHINPLTLDKNDTLTLIWDGNDWIETGYSNN